MRARHTRSREPPFSLLWLEEGLVRTPAPCTRLRSMRQMESAVDSKQVWTCSSALGGMGTGAAGGPATLRVGASDTRQLTGVSR